MKQIWDKRETDLHISEERAKSEKNPKEEHSLNDTVSGYGQREGEGRAPESLCRRGEDKRQRGTLKEQEWSRKKQRRERRASVQ